MNARNAAFFVSALVLLSPLRLWSYSFQLIGPVGGGATDVSADGSWVVGSNGTFAYRWSQATGLQVLGDFPGGLDLSIAYAVSGDGNVVAGVSNDSIGQRAFRWTPTNGMQRLGDLPGGSVADFATAISGNGEEIFGRSHSSRGFEGFRWTSANGMVPLEPFPAGRYDEGPLGSNSDGSIVVGWAETSTQLDLPAVWYGAEPASALPGGHEDVCYATSEDGSTIVGRGSWRAVRWVGGMMQRISPDTESSEAVDVSSDGHTIVGTRALGSRSFIYTDAIGFQDFGAFLTAHGVTGHESFHLSANAISADGLTVAGTAQYSNGDYQSFIATIPEPPTDAILCAALCALALRKQWFGTANSSLLSSRNALSRR